MTKLGGIEAAGVGDRGSVERIALALFKRVEATGLADATGTGACALEIVARMKLIRCVGVYMGVGRGEKPSPVQAVAA
jgi:hypothetical protein